MNSLNDGDDELIKFLEQQMSKVGSSTRNLDYESVTRPVNDVTVDVCGTKLWNGINSDNWRYREAALEAFVSYLQQPTIRRYQKQTEPLFYATLELASIGCRDKLLQVYFLGIKLIELALDPKVCGGDIPSKEIGRRLRPFVTLLIDKIGEMNYRAKDVSETTFSLITRNPSIDLGHVIASLVNLHEKPGGVIKQNWRVVVSRIELLDLLMTENE